MTPKRKEGVAKALSSVNYNNSSDNNNKSAEESSAGLTEDLLKKIKQQSNSNNEESGSSNGDAGGNSDNSALVSIGNTSFGFNFDSGEEGQSPNNSDRDNGGDGGNNDDPDQDSGEDEVTNQKPAMSAETSSTSAVTTNQKQINMKNKNDSTKPPSEVATSNPNASTSAPLGQLQQQRHQQPMSMVLSSGSRSSSNGGLKSSTSSLTNSTAGTSAAPSAPAVAAATPSIAAPVAPSALTRNLGVPPAVAAAVLQQQQLQLSMFATAAPPGVVPPVAIRTPATAAEMLAPPSPPVRKRKTSTGGADDADSSAGYHTDDDEGRSITMQSGTSSVQGDMDGGSGGGKKKRLDERKREERNLREKERSLRISKQINELRSLLSSGGVIVPKGTKSSVLTEAANYIRMLQQHQYRSELDRHQLIQQMQMIGNGAHGAQAAAAVRHVAAQNGVWSLGNFGGVPPKSAMGFYQPPADESNACTTSQAPTAHPNIIDTSEYKFVFNACGVGMAIASLGGAFIDCNQLFCQLSNYSKQEVCGLTIFNLTARQDLQHAFDLISQMISPPLDATQVHQEPKPIVLRGSMKHRHDIGLCVSLVKGEDGIAKCFCVTLIQNPSSPFDTAKPIPVSFDAIRQANPAVAAQQHHSPSAKRNTNMAAPAFTLG